MKNSGEYALNKKLSEAYLDGEYIKQYGYYKGYLWILALNLTSGCTNGYVVIDKNQRGYNYSKKYQDSTIECHGGITWDGYDKHGRRIIGFDTAHAFDFIPKYDNELDLNDDKLPKKIWNDDDLKANCYLIINHLKENEQ